ncbi:Zinc knuckle family protein, partial [Aphelenchoides avenae]
MSSLTPEDFDDYPRRPVVSPRPDWESDTETEYSDSSSESDSDQSADGVAYGSVVLNKTNGPHRACLLECVRTKIAHPETGAIVEAVIFFDSGSTHSYVHSDFAEKINLTKLRKSNLVVHTFGQDKPVKLNGYDTRIRFHFRNGKPLDLNVTTSDYVTSNLEAVFISAKHLPALKAGKCAIVPSEHKVNILIGRGDFHHFGRENAFRTPSGFEVVKTHLGWMLAGTGYIRDERSEPTARSCFATAKPAKEEDPLNRAAEAFWHIERTGMENSKPKADDEMVYKRVRAETIINKDGRYEVPLVFKTPNGEPPSNMELPQQKQAAIGRLESGLRTLRKYPKILGAYQEYLEGLIARGEAEIIPPEEWNTQNSVHYLAHHHVVKETSSTTK